MNFNKKNYQEKRKRILTAIREAETDAVLITTGPNRLYASGVQTSRGLAVITAQDDAFFLTDSRYREAAEIALKGRNMQLIDNTCNSMGVLKELIDRLGIRRLGIENLHMTMEEYSNYSEALDAELVYMDSRLDRNLIVLSEEDRDCLEYAQSIAEKALTETLDQFRIGMTERELSALLVWRMFANGADELSFRPEILSGANASMPHGTPSDKPIVPGDVLLMDFGCVKDGYWSDMSRTFAVGYADEQLEAVYDTVLQAQKLAIEAHHIGISGKELDAAARDYIMRSGIPGCYEHALGHGIGPLEASFVAPQALAGRESSCIFQAGYTCSIEPGIYQPGILGCRIEDLIWLGPDGRKVNLNHFPTEKLIVLK